MKIRRDTFAIFFGCIGLIGMEIIFLTFYYIPPFISLITPIVNEEAAVRAFNLVNYGTVSFVTGMLGLLACNIFDSQRSQQQKKEGNSP